MRRSVLAAVLLVLAFAPAALAGTAAGFVTSGAQERPLEGALVELDLDPADDVPEFETRTSAFGLWQVEDVPAGTYRVRASRADHAPDDSNMLAVPASGTEGVTVNLTPLGVELGIDLHVQVRCVKTQVPLPNTLVNLYRYDAAESPAPTHVFPTFTMADGSTGALGVPPGFYEMDATLTGWDFLAHPPAGRVFLGTNQLIEMELKPQESDLVVTVTGDDPLQTMPAPGSALKGVIVEVTGLALATDDEVIPARALLTDETGSVTVKKLPPIRWKVEAKRLGYESVSTIVQAVGGVLPATDIALVLEPTTLEIQLSSIYPQASILSGAMAEIIGVTASGSEGIVRDVTADGAGKITVDRLLPGRYIARVGHSKIVGGLQASSGGILPPGPTSFTISFMPEEISTEVALGETRAEALQLEPIRARIVGRLMATDENADPRADLAHSGRVRGPMAASDVTFAEHESVNILPLAEKSVVRAADSDGRFSLEILPGRYGIEIPSLEGWTGHDVVVGLKTDTGVVIGTEMGWPYRQQWPWTGFESGHHAGFVHFSSGDEIEMILNVHENDVALRHLVSELNAGDPCQTIVVFNDGTTSFFTQGNDLVLNGQGTVTGTQSRMTPLTERTPSTIEAVHEHLPAGSYQLSATHPRFTFDTKAVTVAPWTHPGALPGVNPSSPSWFFPGISHFVNQTVQGTYAAPGIIEYREFVYDFDALAYNLSQTTQGADYVRTAYLGLSLCGPVTTANAPAGGAWQAWKRYGSEWFAGSGTGGATFDVFIDGPSKNVSSAQAPPFAGGYPLRVLTVSKDDPDLRVGNVRVNFSGGTFVETDANGEANVTHDGSADVISVANTPWSLVFSTRRTTSVNPPSIEVIVKLHRGMTVSGRVVTLGRAVPEISVQLTNRYGDTIGAGETNASGNFSITTPAAIQPFFVVVSGLGFIPLRNPYTPAASQTSIQVGDLELEPVPPPDVTLYKLDRKGLFLPGVLKSGDSSIGFDPDNAKDGLTATWRVEWTHPSVSYDVQEFDDRSGPRGITEKVVTDPVTAVWIVDRRAFPEPAVNDPLQSFDFIDPPCEGAPDCTWFSQQVWPEVDRWLDEIESGKKDGQPYHVVLSKSLRADPDGAFTGKFPLWHLPSGEFSPYAVVTTRLGGVRIVPLGAESQPALKGLRTPKWVASFLDALGSASNFPAGTVAPSTPKGTFMPSLKDEASIDVDTFGFLTYEYKFGVEWSEGSAAPGSGPLSLGPRLLGWTFRDDKPGGLDGVKARVLVRGQEQDVSLGIEATASKEFDSIKKSFGPPWRAVAFELKEPKVEGTGRVEVVDTIGEPPTGPLNLIPDYRFRSTLEASLGAVFEVDLSGVIGYLSAAIPVAGPAISVLFKSGALQGFLAFPMKIGARITHVEETLFPVPASTVFGNAPPNWHALGGATGSGTPPTLTFDVGVLFGARIGARLGGGYGEAQIGAQVGPPENLQLMGLELKVDPRAWPIVRRARGALSIAGHVQANIVGFTVKKTFQYDAHRIDWQVGTEAVVTITPLGGGTVVIGPSAVADNGFSGGSEDFLRSMPAFTRQDLAENMLAFIGVDPATDQATVETTVRSADTWSTPVVVASAGAILDVGVAPNAAGGWTVVWLELLPADAGDPFAPVRVMTSTSDASGQAWTAPALIGTLPASARSLHLEAAGAQLVLVIETVEGGPLGDAGLTWARRSGGTWSALTQLAAPGDVFDLALAGNGPAAPSPASVLTVRRADGFLEAWRWNGTSWLGPDVVEADDADGAVAAAWPSGGVPVVAWRRSDGKIALSRFVSGAWQPFAEVGGVESPADLSLLAVMDGGSRAWMLAWPEGLGDTQITTAYVTDAGALLRDQAPVTGCSQGLHGEVELQSEGGLDALVVAQRSDAELDVVAFETGLVAPSFADQDDDGVPDACDTCPAAANSEQFDSDGDGLGDECDPCPIGPDTDGDGTCAPFDNCPGLGNAGQEDSDEDGKGDACDPCPLDFPDDTDEDGACDADDNCPTLANADQADADADDIGDACDACPADNPNDADGDGICLSADNCPNASNADQANVDGDALGDACDVDVQITIGDVQLAGTTTAHVPLTLAVPAGCASEVAFTALFDDAVLDALGATPSSGACSVLAQPDGVGRLRVTVTCAAGHGPAPTQVATLDFEVTSPPAGQVTLVVGCSEMTALDCGLPADPLTPWCDAGSIATGCKLGDIFPDALGDGNISLADFVIARRKVSGTVPRNARDLSCGDSHPGSVTCVKAGADNWCRTGDGDLDLGDAIVIRRFVSQVLATACAACSTASSQDPAEASALLVPGDATLDGRLDVSDAVRLLRASVGLEPLSAAALPFGDVSPSVASGDAREVRGNGAIDVADVVSVLRASVGLDRLEWRSRSLDLTIEAESPIAGWSVTLTGWPLGTTSVTVASGPCGDAGGADLDGTRAVVLCSPDEPARRADVVLSYRAPSPASPPTLHLDTSALDDSLTPIDAQSSVR